MNKQVSAQLYLDTIGRIKQSGMRNPLYWRVSGKSIKSQVEEGDKSEQATEADAEKNWEAITSATQNRTARGGGIER